MTSFCCREQDVIACDAPAEVTRESVRIMQAFLEAASTGRIQDLVRPLP